MSDEVPNLPVGNNTVVPPAEPVALTKAQQIASLITQHGRNAAMAGAKAYIIRTIKAEVEAFHAEMARIGAEIQKLEKELAAEKKSAGSADKPAAVEPVQSSETPQTQVTK